MTLPIISVICTISVGGVRKIPSATRTRARRSVVLSSCHALNLSLSNPVLYILLLLVAAWSAWYCGRGPARRTTYDCQITFHN
jgi:hypothetical protein